MDTNDIRFKIAASRRILARNDCESAVAGHVSARAEGEDAFWVSPFEYFDETLPDRVVKSSFDLQLLRGGLGAVAGHQVPRRHLPGPAGREVGDPHPLPLRLGPGDDPTRPSACTTSDRCCSSRTRRSTRTTGPTRPVDPDLMAEAARRQAGAAHQEPRGGHRVPVARERHHRGARARAVGPLPHRGQGDRRDRVSRGRGPPGPRRLSQVLPAEHVGGQPAPPAPIRSRTSSSGWSVETSWSVGPAGEPVRSAASDQGIRR